MAKEDKALDVLYTNARRVLDLDLFSVAMFNKVTLQLDFPLVRRTAGNGSKKIRSESRAYQPDRYLADRVLSTGQALVIGTSVDQWLQEHKLEHESKQPPLSCMAVPMKARDQVLGVIVAEHYKHDRAYDQRTLSLLSTMAGRVGSTIANTSLIDNLSQVIQLGQTMMSGIRLSEDEIVERIFEQIGKLINTDDAYIALYDAGRRFLSFPIITQDGQPDSVVARVVDLDAKPPAGLTEVVLKTQAPLRIADVPAWCKDRNLTLPVKPDPKSWMGVPMRLQETLLGIISVQNDEIQGLFGQDDEQVLQALADQAAAALHNTRLYYDLDQRLAALMQAHERPQQVLDLIYSQVSRSMDTRAMYIAIYDEARQELTFPLAFMQGERQEWPPRPVDLAAEPPAGLTEIVLRTRESLRIEDGPAFCAERRIRILIGSPPLSWLGVPIVYQDRLLGIIALYNDDYRNAFGPEDEEMLQAMAALAAIALENARLFQAARSEVIAAKQLATLGTATAALQHRINNTFNIIVPNMIRLRKRVDTTDKTIVQILDIIERNARYTSDIIARIQDPLREVDIQEVDVNSVLADVIADIPTPDPSQPDRAPIKVILDLDDSLPLIRAPIGQISEIFRNLAENARRAMADSAERRLTVTSYMQDHQICVRVQDTGPGIPPHVQERLFKLPVPSSEPGGGAGLGLWLSLLILQSIGGDVTVASTGSQGTTMLVQIPLPP